MIVEIIQGHHFPEPKQQKNGVKYYQRCYVHFGGAFPAEFQFQVDNPRGHEPGKYELGPKSFRIVSNFGRQELQINPFELELIPVKPAASQVKAAG